MNIDRIVNEIAEANESELGTIFVEAVRRLGQLGRDGREAVQIALDSGNDEDVEEGVAQLNDAIDGYVPLG